MQAFLSEVELYYSSSFAADDFFTIAGEEAHHIVNVMRHRCGDKLFIANGLGDIAEGNIVAIDRGSIDLKITNKLQYSNFLENITFCIPNLKNHDRLEFALEKSIELGITNFVFYQAGNSFVKKFKLERLDKIALAAMKQSLRAFLPKIEIVDSTKKLLPLINGKVITLEQKCENSIQTLHFEKEERYYFIFGPEGGFSNDENTLLESSVKVFLTENRLRSETAIISTASVLSNIPGL